jgi:predicted MPP superfamily phosphohydrolase
MGLGLGLYATRRAPARLVVTRYTLTLPRWPDELDGVLLTVIADLHIGCARGSDWSSPALTAAVEAVRAAEPDLLLVAGDFGFTRWNPHELGRAADLFEATARVAVLGNHDYVRGAKCARALTEALSARGFAVLANEAHRVVVRGHPLWVAGLDDGTSGRADFAKMLGTLQPAAHPVILLSHSPDAVTGAPAGVFDLAVAGHTHGGQIAIPAFNPLVLRKWARTKFDRGFYCVNGIPLFVTKGLGMVGHHARFRSRPEVVLLRMRSPRGQSELAGRSSGSPSEG